MYGGKPEAPISCLDLWKPGAEVLSEANAAGRYVLSTSSFDFGSVPSALRGASQWAYCFSRGDEVLRPKMRNGGFGLPDLADSLHQSPDPEHFDAREAVTPPAPR